MTIEYRSNNSGGRWWLTDGNWRALEAAGWSVEWSANKRDGFSQPDADGRWLGALATTTSKDFDSVADALREFESLTGADVSDDGCNCCGPPHSFSWTDESGEYHWASGSDCLQYLYKNVPTTLREAAKRLN